MKRIATSSPILALSPLPVNHYSLARRNYFIPDCKTAYSTPSPFSNGLKSTADAAWGRKVCNSGHRRSDIHERAYQQASSSHSAQDLQSSKSDRSNSKGMYVQTILRLLHHHHHLTSLLLLCSPSEIITGADRRRRALQGAWAETCDAKARGRSDGEVKAEAKAGSDTAMTKTESRMLAAASP